MGSFLLNFMLLVLLVDSVFPSASNGENNNAPRETWRSMIDLPSGCGGEITSPRFIKSPVSFNEDDDEPESYPNNANCTWIIRAPTDQVVQLAFTKFELEGEYNYNYREKCNNDFVFVFDEIDRKNNNSEGLGLFCGDLNDRLPIVKSKTNIMYVTFASDTSERFSGFVGEISFTYGELQGCGGTIRLNQSKNMSEYTLKTPNLPVKSDLNCGWLIFVDPSYEVQIELKSYTETPKCPLNSTSCGCSSIQVFDGPGYLASRIHKYCSGNMDNPSIRSSGSEVYISYTIFNADVNVNFEIKISQVISVCGPKTLLTTNQTQVLTSPNYPQPSENNLICNWTLEKNIPNRTPIVLRFTNVNLGGTKDCSSDYLEVYYVPMLFIPINIRLCHEDHEIDLMSDSDVTLKLHTNDQRASKGFRLEYKYSKCQTSYNKSNGKIRYDYSLGMHQPKVCTFTINSPQQNSTISVYIYMTPMSFTVKKPAVSLMAYDGHSNSSKLISNFTGLSTTPSPIFSSGPSLTMMYELKGGWSGVLDITYTSTDKGQGCGGNLFNIQGSVTSPLYPAEYKKSATCRWDIAVPRPYPIEIGFQVFHLGAKETCATDFIEIYEVNQMTGTSSFVTKYCGGDKPVQHTIQSGAIFIRYVTSEHNNGSGWVLQYGLKHQAYPVV